MEIDRHIEALQLEAQLFAGAARRTDLDAPVSSCPGWDVRDLVRHLAEIHLWAAAQVANRAAKMWVDDLSELSGYWPDLAVFWPGDAELIDWYLETNLNLVRELTSAPVDLECRTFLPAPSPLAMWARRQAHETAVHRFDAESAGMTPTSFDPEFATDGIDELLASFAPRGTRFSIDSPGTMAVHANDTDTRWHVTMAPNGITSTGGGHPADVTLIGPASELYLALWNRGDDSTIEVVGNRDVLDTWHNGHRVRWSRARVQKRERERR
ncbi:maleylpyruvate isomerase family mycothiol-dependent enzyme [Janibacter cremeus]|uniref:maleylpyruvate isomerase family mycothiol-dependent enzyme n=1 Tax=Janibacter cremeus TaxID=1285192 RepID=UPI0023F9DA5A|nr:maleylpyruvate isomerase family mycothiol-dependent enzyme [Janibacter cremeus]WEV77823.1 maleylpyruvate isomerase family mycothiol-dependent enzyme [Janibacter cremeus]